MATLAILLAALLVGGLLTLGAPDAGLASSHWQTYDDDQDNLIEITTLAQLDAIRHDLDGNGDATHADYLSAFPDLDTSTPASQMGCAATCIGYELMANLDFDTNNSGAADAGDTYYNSGAGWTPIGGHGGTPGAFVAIFEGNNHTISNLFIDLSTTGNTEGNFVGLFADIGLVSGNPDHGVRNLRLVNPSVSSTRTGSGQYARVSALAGRINLTARVSNVSIVGGAVTATQNGSATLSVAGCLVGFNLGEISDSSATCSVRATGSGTSATDRAGGIVGWSERHTSRSHHTTGTVKADNQAGGVVGYLQSGGRLTDSYATSAVSTDAANSSAGGLAGGLSGVGGGRRRPS